MELIAILALWWAPVLALVFLLQMAGAVRIRPGWLITAMVIYAVYVAAIRYGGDYIPLEDYLGPLSWNWAGKIAAIASTLAVFAALALATKAITPENAGFTLRQRDGSVLPACIAAFLLTGSVIALEILAADGRDLGLERLAYQATMPGLDEELFFRGLLLAAVAAAVPSRGVNLLGARITVAGLLVTLLFGLGHGVAFEDGNLQISWIFVILTAYLGFGLLWIRERTGSVLAPLIAHNIINVAGSFF